MTTYRLYAEPALRGITGKYSLKKEGEFSDDGEARAAFWPVIMILFSDAYAVSVRITKIVGDGEETVL